MTWIDPSGDSSVQSGGTARLGVRRLGHAVIVTATGDLGPADERPWCDLVLAACISTISVRLVVVDLSGVTDISAVCGAALTRANKICAEHGRELRVLAGGSALTALRRDGLDRLVTVAGDIHRALLSSAVHH